VKKYSRYFPVCILTGRFTIGFVEAGLMMRSFLAIFFATVAAVGNAMFALAQKKSEGVENWLLFVGVSALIAALCSFLSAPLMGPCHLETVFKNNWKAMVLSGVGLYLCYFGITLLYSHYGASLYALYAVLAIISTTIIVGIFWLKEPVNIYHKIAIALSIAAVVFFSMGQSKS
jgi:drug/metabolite transporter (DMT)-like permease